MSSWLTLSILKLFWPSSYSCHAYRVLGLNSPIMFWFIVFCIFLFDNCLDNLDSVGRWVKLFWCCPSTMIYRWCIGHESCGLVDFDLHNFSHVFDSLFGIYDLELTSKMFNICNTLAPLNLVTYFFLHL